MNTDFCNEWGDSALIFTSDEITKENHFGRYLWLDLAHNPAKAIIDCSYRPFLQRIVCSDLALWRRHSSICDVKRMRGTDIMPCSSIVLARANWHKGDLH